jgi:hypothetical protein
MNVPDALGSLFSSGKVRGMRSARDEEARFLVKWHSRMWQKEEEVYVGNYIWYFYV